jgi:hypothetical protein
VNCGWEYSKTRNEQRTKVEKVARKPAGLVSANGEGMLRAGGARKVQMATIQRSILAEGMA